MPELPDVTVYVEALERFIVGHRLDRLRVLSPFVLRSVEPPVEAAAERQVLSARRLGKRIAIGLEGELYVVVHLMVAGRLHWRPPGAKLTRRSTLAAFVFSHGLLVLTEAGSKRRASLHLVSGREGLAEHDPGGFEVLSGSRKELRTVLTRESHTLKRALTDPHILAGIGNAYSDEILHRARLSPFKLTTNLSEDDLDRLHTAAVAVLQEWTERLRRTTGEGFPEKVTAFHEEMAVHGRYGKPCPECGSPVQRIVYAENEANYCATCQTGGRLLADRTLSRLLKADWPRTVDELERRRSGD